MEKFGDNPVKSTDSSNTSIIEKMIIIFTGELKDNDIII